MQTTKLHSCILHNIHLKNHETVAYQLSNCNFEGNFRSTFQSYKNRSEGQDFKTSKQLNRLAHLAQSRQVLLWKKKTDSFIICIQMYCIVYMPADNLACFKTCHKADYWKST